MSLTIYDINDKISMNIEKFNDLFFNANPDIPDSDLVRKLLREIDNAERITDCTFRGRVKYAGELNSINLSTGTKTALNVIKYRDECFDVCECGDNVLKFLLKNVHDGSIFWDYPVVVTDDNFDCDIQYKHRHFNNVYSFIDYVLRG